MEGGFHKGLATSAGRQARYVTRTLRSGVLKHRRAGAPIRDPNPVLRSLQDAVPHGALAAHLVTLEKHQMVVSDRVKIAPAEPAAARGARPELGCRTCLS